MKITTKGNIPQGEVHSFNTEEASLYGVEKAIILYNIRFWLRKNLANGKHIHDGFVWTYNSSTAFAKLFTYMSSQKLDRLLRELENEDEVLKSGNYNGTAYDRTKWYTIPQEFSIHSSDLKNGTAISEEPIPDINTDKKTVSPRESDESDSVSQEDSEEEDDITIDEDVDDEGNPKTNSFGRFKSGKSIHVKPPSARNKEATAISVWFAREAQKAVSSKVPVQITGYTRLKELLEKKKDGLTGEQIREVLTAHLEKGLSDKDTVNIYLALSPKNLNEYFSE